MPAKIFLRKNSFTDFPGKISTVLFFPGCNLRCPWCHNPDLVTGEAEDLISFEECMSYIHKRRDVLGGVVLSGGEPTLQKDLPDMIAEINKLGLPVKLDTNGMLPAMLEKLFSSEETRPAYIALDLKTAPDRYSALLPEQLTHSGTLPDGKNAAKALSKSAALIRESGIAHEYRSLALPGGYFEESDVEKLTPLADSSPWYIRLFQGGNCLDPAWNDLEEPPHEVMPRVEALAARARELGKNCVLPAQHPERHG